MPSLAYVMRKDLKKVAHDVSVRDAARRMRDERIGSLFGSGLLRIRIWCDAVSPRARI
jgi:hypothetical protein